ESGRAGRDGGDAQVVVWWKPSDLYRLASLACESRDRSAAMAQLIAAARYCDDDATTCYPISNHTCIADPHTSPVLGINPDEASIASCANPAPAPEGCRREHFARLFGQSSHSCWREEGLRCRRCCDICGAGEKERQPPCKAALARGGCLAACLLRALHEANTQAEQAGETDAAPAHLTALKLVEKAAAPAKKEGFRLSREELERVVLRLVLAEAIRISFVFTSYSILSYLYVRVHAHFRLCYFPRMTLTSTLCLRQPLPLTQP
ncbi:MAG: hypothetical protein SGPRY_013964, partial [Prymnesium sp.]